MSDDEKIIELFFARSEEAIRELDQKYGRLCHRISNNILNNRLDAEECVNSAYQSVWDAIPPARPDSLQAWLCKIVRNLSLKQYRRKTAEKRNSVHEVAMEELTEYLPAPGTVESEVDAKELARLIEEFLDGLTAENRILFMLRYSFSDSCAAIAEKTGLSEKNVSVRLSRIRKKLKDFLIQKEVFV